MNDYLKDLRSAFQSVSVDFYNVPALDRNGNPAVQHPEDNYCTELIRHLRNLTELKDKQKSYRGLRYDFSMIKNRFGIQPDLVLHAGADNQNRQELFIEVKAGTNSNFKADLNKLKTAISTDLNFKNAVMIVINKNLTSTIRIIKEFVSNSQLPENDLGKIYLFHSKPESSNHIRYSYFTFNNLKNQISG